MDKYYVITGSKFLLDKWYWTGKTWDTEMKKAKKYKSRARAENAVSRSTTNGMMDAVSFYCVEEIIIPL